jgi:elongation factor G
MTRRIALSKVRNFGIVAHVDAGKTTLTERVLFACGAIHKKGDVHHGNTKTDSHPIERKRAITISSAAVTAAWGDHELHLIDTPGHVDFAVEVERSLRVLDGAVVVLDGVAGVEPQTESVWRRADRRRLPRIAFVNKLDRAGADFARCVDDLRERLRANPIVLALPWLDADGSLLGVVDVVRRRALRWPAGLVAGANAYVVEAVPSSLASVVETARAAVVTSLADIANDANDANDADDAAHERIVVAVVEGREADVDDASIVSALRAATIANAIVPVLCGAAYRDKGVEPLLDAIVDLLPSPADVTDDHDDAPLLATAFKVVHDSFGAMTLVRVHAGTLVKGAVAISARTNKRVRIGRVVSVFADSTRDVDAAYAGDIAGLPGLALATGDTLCAPEHVVALESFAFDPPVLTVAIEPKARADRDALGSALSRLLAEDPSLVVKTDEETGETTLSGMGELHLEVAVEKLRGDHGVDAVTGKPRVAYTETITKSLEHELLWRKQGGGPGQYARVRLRLAPASRGEGFVFVDEVKGGAVPREYIPAVERGVEDALARGIVHGVPVVDVVVTLLDGAWHEQDSSDLAFRLCAAACFVEAAKLAEPRVLEPVMTVVVTIAEDRVGDVVGDLLRRRGIVAGIDATGEERVPGAAAGFAGAIAGDDASLRRAVVVRAEVPLAEMFGYAGDLRSRTQGRGTFTMSLAHLAMVPPNAAATLRM